MYTAEKPCTAILTFSFGVMAKSCPLSLDNLVSEYHKHIDSGYVLDQLVLFISSGSELIFIANMTYDLYAQSLSASILMKFA